MKKCYFTILLAIFVLLEASFSYADKPSTPTVILSGEPAFFNYSKESLVFGVEEGYPTSADVVESDNNIIQIGEIPILSIDDFKEAHSKYFGETVPVKTLVNGDIITETRLIDKRHYDVDMYGYSASTFGTISFYIPEMNMGFALGHPISNGKIFGNIIKGKVTGHDDETIIMKKESNSKGNTVFGQIECQNNNGVIFSYDINKVSTSKLKSIQIARKDEIELGTAYIYTDLGKGKKLYEINIIALNGYDYKIDTPIYNDLITFIITDKRLVSKGLDYIFTGMSGAPIIQNDKLIAINGYGSEIYGYGIYAETAYNSMLDYYREKEKLHSSNCEINHGYLIKSYESNKEIDLQNGDIIVAINDKGLFGISDINSLVQKYLNKRKNDIKFTIVRDGRILDVFISKKIKLNLDCSNLNYNSLTLNPMFEFQSTIR